jgi:hypothetical protein
MREGLTKLNDDDVVLHGRVVDQFGSPVANAVVSGIIQVNNGTRVGTDRMSTVTDSSGLFTLSGYRGKNLGVNITKAGYVLATTSTSFVYSHLWPETQRHVPDPNNPVVFRMWKLQGAEPLAGINNHLEINYTSDPIRFDLLTGKIVPAGGDVEIVVSRPAGTVSQQHPQEWSVQLRAVDGGLVETTAAESSVTFIAPGDGYQAIVKVRGDSGSDGLDRFFFIESRAGQIHGKVRFTFRINNTPDGIMYASFQGVASTNGSRNWEATTPQAQ